MMRNEIREKVIALATRRGGRVPELRDDEIIPETGLLDSAAVMELIVWLEGHFGIEIDSADMTIDNLGSVDSMVEYVSRALTRPVA
jgi:D-alanine--poly(phosphoribitol) ligase subunit 2